MINGNLRSACSITINEKSVGSLGGIRSMLLDRERYDVVITYGKDAMNKLKENKSEDGFSIAE